MQYPPTTETELFAASQSGDTKVVQALLRSGADANQAIDASTGWSALAAALVGGHGRVAEALLQAGASTATLDRRGNTPMHACAAGLTAADGDEVGLSVAASMLNLDSGESAQAVNHEGVMPLHLAAQQGKCALIELLVKYGAPLSAVDRAGHDPFFYRKDPVTERLLLKLIAEAAVRASHDTSSKLRPARLTGLPWNLADPGPQELSSAQLVQSLYQPAPARKDHTDRRTPPKGVVGVAMQPPAKTIPPPPAPELPEAGRIPVKQYRHRSARTSGEVPRAQALTIEQERRAAYLAYYLTSQSRVSTRQPEPKEGSLEDKLKRAFASADSDGSRAVSKRELMSVMEKAGLSAISSSEGLRLFQEADKDGDGQLTLDEFALLARRIKPLLNAPATERPSPSPADQLNPKARSQLRKAFSDFDVDNRGWISISELNGALRACGMYVDDTRLRKMFTEADLDRSGGIDVNEFEVLIQRLTAQQTAGHAHIAPPAAGSTIAAVFEALQKGSTGLISVRELPHGLRLLGVDPQEPPVMKVVDAASATGAMDRHAFCNLVHRLLRRDFESITFDAPGVPRPVPPGMAKCGSSGNRSPRRSPSKAATKAAIPPDEPPADRTRKLAQAFVSCDSYQDGTVTLRDVSVVLQQAGVDLDAMKTMDGTIATSLSRIKFEELLQYIEGSNGLSIATALQGPNAGLPDLDSQQSLRLRTGALALAGWVLALPSVQTLCTMIRGVVRMPVARSSGVVSVDNVPVMVRSSMVHKQAGDVDVEMDVHVPPGLGLLEIELLYQDMPTSVAPLASATLDLGDLVSGPFPLPVKIPLYDQRSVQAGVLHIQAELASSQPSPPTAAIGQPAASPPAPATDDSTSIAELEAELVLLRKRASELERLHSAASAQKRTEQRLRVVQNAIDSTSSRHTGDEGSNETPRSSISPLLNADWRGSCVAMLNRTMHTVRDAKMTEVLHMACDALAKQL